MFLTHRSLLFPAVGGLVCERVDGHWEESGLPASGTGTWPRHADRRYLEGRYLEMLSPIWPAQGHFLFPTIHCSFFNVGPPKYNIRKNVREDGDGKLGAEESQEMAEGRWQMETSRKSQTVGLCVGKGFSVIWLGPGCAPVAHTGTSGTIPDTSWSLHAAGSDPEGQRKRKKVSVVSV